MKEYILHELMEGVMTTQMLTACINLEFNKNFTCKQIYNKMYYYAKRRIIPIQRYNTGKHAYWAINPMY